MTTAASHPYVVVNVNQNSRQPWSRHSTLALARAAARRYKRRNPSTDYWVDHYGFDIEFEGEVIENIGAFE